MSYLKQAAAIAGLTIITATAGAQSTSSTGNATSTTGAVNATSVNRQTLDMHAPVGRASAIPSGEGGNTTYVAPTRVIPGSVSTDGDFKVRINTGPMAGQTLTINPEKETFSVTTYPWHGPAETVSGNLTKPATTPAYLVGRLLEGNYQTKTGDVRATCEVTKDSYISEGLKPVIKPEYISYSFNCKTQFGDASVRVTPYNDKGNYTYNTQAIINSDPATGKMISIETPWPQADIAFKRN